jgi:4-hydroxy-tetrahydrodipicolinate synthase
MFTALPTPMLTDGALDADALERLVDYQIINGAAGLLPLGGTGEGASLGIALRRRVVEVTVSAAAGRVPVLASVLDAGFGGAIDSANVYHDAGASGLMVIPPYYAHPDQAAVQRYFRALVKELRLPIVLYDNPYRTRITISPETIAAMAEERLIVGIKASNTDLYHFDNIAMRVSDEFGLLSGHDTVYVEQVLLGAKGNILGSTCLMPQYWNVIQSQIDDGKIADAVAAQRRLYPFLDALFAEEFPTGVRVAFEILGLPIGKSIAPIGALSKEASRRLETTIADLLSAGILHRFN